MIFHNPIKDTNVAQSVWVPCHSKMLETGKPQGAQKGKQAVFVHSSQTTTLFQSFCRVRFQESVKSNEHYTSNDERITEMRCLWQRR